MNAKLSPELAALFYAAIEADNAWANALSRAGLGRWDAGSCSGAFAVLFAAKVAAYEAFRTATFPHASK